MILPDSRNQFSSYRNRGKGRKRLILIIVSVVLVAAVIWQWDNISGRFSRKEDPLVALEDLWEQQRYEEINLQCDAVLAGEPLNVRALIYGGFSYFYRGVNQFSFEDKIAFFDLSIAHLRKARLLDIGELAGRLYYVLGKAYYYKGKFYADLTIRYLTMAEESGYIADDTYEYLGLAHSELGRYEESAESFLKAVEQEPTDMRYLALAQAYFNQGLTDRSEEYLLRTLNKTSDPAVETKTRFLLGKIYLESDQLTKAEDQYRRVLESNPISADAYYFLGEIFLRYDKITEARYNWRQAYNIDPSHYGARLRLF